MTNKIRLLVTRLDCSKYLFFQTKPSQVASNSINRVSSNSAHAYLTRPLYDQVNNACGVLDKFACNGGDANGGAKKKMAASIWFPVLFVNVATNGCD
ncbi:hypothetical protein YC2023_087230 [Brassica napus]